MSSQICWRCLARARVNTSDASQLHRTRLAVPISPFSTSAALRANPVKAKPVISKRQAELAAKQKTRGKKQSYAKGRSNTGRESSSKRVVTVDRKDKKRIVLSNTNALEVKGMEDIGVKNAIDNEYKGRVLGIPGPIIDQLKAVEAFKPNQGWALYRRPAMLMREETIALAKEMEILKDEKRAVRRILDGERWAGKTTMLLQAMTLAFLNEWVVINIPKGTISCLIK